MTNLDMHQLALHKIRINLLSPLQLLTTNWALPLSFTLAYPLSTHPVDVVATILEKRERRKLEMRSSLCVTMIESDIAFVFQTECIQSKLNEVHILLFACGTLSM